MMNIGNEAGHNVGSLAGPSGNMGSQGGTSTKSLSGSRNSNGTRTGINSVAPKVTTGPTVQQQKDALATATGNSPFRTLFGKIMGWTDQQQPNAPTPPGDPNNVYSPAGALAEAQRQRPLSDKIAKGLRAVATLAGMPGMSAAIGLGDAMGSASEDVLAQHPEAIHSIPGVPGGIYGRVDGMMYSNRADVPGYNTGLGKQNGAQRRNATPVQAVPYRIGSNNDDGYYDPTVTPASHVNFGDLLKVYGGK